MKHVVKLPKLGETADDVVVIEWMCEVGEEVAVGDVLMTVETDKVNAEVPSPVAGTVAEQHVAPGDEIDTGTKICTIKSSS